ncbi:MAG TPA: hypothetical protein VEF04_01335 [Blastocatellia bacterium]|nr:hypothetical protein [Blastocatellia bacterium]
MAQWHLQEIREAFENRGWRFVGELPSDDHNVSAYWQFQRSPKEPVITIAFEGLDDLETLPLEQAYGCHIVGQETIGLYFKRRSRDDKERHKIWRKSLVEFIDQVNKFVNDQLKNNL